MDRLKGKRAARRAQVTKLVNELAELRAQDNVHKTTLESLLARLISNDTELRQINKDVEPLLKPDELEEEYPTIIAYEDEAHGAIAELRTRIAETQITEQPTTQNPSVPTSSGAERPRAGAKLPKLQLQCFAGELTRWQAFWEHYKTTIHDNTTLAKAEKFQYLRSLLRGSAASAIMGLQATESCYDDAIEILKERFGDRSRIEREHLSRLRSLPAVRSTGDVHGLRKLYDHVQNHVRGLRALGVSSESYASMMVDILFTSLPQDMVVEYHRLARYTSTDEQESTSGSESEADEGLTKVLNFLRIEIESRERSGVRDRNQNPNKGNGSDKKSSSFIPTGAVLQNGVQLQNKCFFCDASDHAAPQCQGRLSPSEKKNKLAKNMRCFRCTKRGHRSKDCRARITCDHCGKRHASSMCSPPETGEKNESQVESTNIVAINTAPVGQDSNVLLQTFRARLTSGSKTTYLRGLIDGGSQRTFVREDVAKRLKLKVVGETSLQLNTFANDTTTRRPVVKVKIVQLVLHSQYNSEAYIIEALTIPFICKDLTATPTDNEFIRSVRRHKGFIADEVTCPNIPGESGISVLIGCDHMWRLLSGEVCRSKDNDKLVAISTVFGWTFQGPTTLSAHLGIDSTTAVCVLRVGVTEKPPPDYLKRFWELESVGIVDDEKNNTLINSSVMEEFEENITFADGRYQVALPWKAGMTTLPDNLEVAKCRLQSLVRRLQRDGSVREYDDAIRAYAKNDHAERATVDARDSDCTCYYMPHRAVIRDSSTSTRLRVVFDASSHGHAATSLNDHLEKGPKLNSDLIPILLRFRMYKIAITADIQKAFLQISIRPSDRDALRFLWFSSPPFPGAPLPALEHWRMTRVPFGTSASPFLLAATLQHHLQNTKGTDEDIAVTLASSFYVDDLLMGADTLDEARRITAGAQAIMQRAGMRLSKWSSSAMELQSVFEELNTDNCNVNKRLGDTEDRKVLGIVWDRTGDNFRFSAEHLLITMTAATPTKRSVLQTCGKIFDPLGFPAPYTIRAKILFQRIWERGLDWDNELPDDLLQEWKSWCEELPKLGIISLERCLTPVNGTGYTAELHIFTDASPQAYGACVFVRTVDDMGAVKVGLLFAKSRVAPIKKLTLPRLELMGAVIGIRIAKLVRDSLQILSGEPTYWTDSTIVLSWIKGDSSRWKPFVKNRVTEIQSNSDPSQWRHCPGASNPADALTRGLRVDVLAEYKQWFIGPEWMRIAPELWPPTSTQETELDMVQEEQRVQDVAVNHVQIKTDLLLNPKDYSNYQRILRVTAWIFRFAENCRRRNRKNGPLTAEEMDRAEIFCIKQVQSDAYADEVLALSHGLALQKSSRIAELQPYLDGNGLLRLTGRLQCAEESEEIKHPILLPKEHELTRHIVEAAHRRTLHGGLQATLSEIREKWWIIRARQLVKTVINQCRVCARFRACHATAPTAPLPADRLERTHPFDTTGIDFAGPLYVKVSDTQVKSYIALFTCATSRAVHLELVSDLTTKAFVMAFRRFISRRGVPSTVYSDNALTFKRAERDIRNLWNVIRNEEVQNFASEHRIHWKYIVERAAWWGGFWERMVRTVKQCLRRVLGRQCLTFEEMTTVLHEAEATVNSRPLTYLFTSPTEPSALTPAHLLIGRTLTALPSPPPSTIRPSTAAELRKRWRHLQTVADQFWRRWRREYLLELKSAHVARVDNPVGIKEGDVALLHEDKIPRHLWKLVRILELYKGRDGQVRSCVIKLPSGRITRRPVQLLFPLECL
ncbi:uncharacterized protein LOC135389726 [Ornithodoros turicata]|uniref:uncharacterized protein LOC135389726 n=1 Tax=Ornithodoros turicata TaxID=34597 RepID=UPI00313A3D00